MSRRCSWWLYLLDHDRVMLRQKREAGANGQPVIPHTLVWECLRCGRQLGETTTAPKHSLLSELAAQVWARAQGRRRAADLAAAEQRYRRFLGR